MYSHNCHDSRKCFHYLIPILELIEIKKFKLQTEETKGVHMKKLVKVEEVEGEGLIGLMGEIVTLYCQIYIYTGKLVGVNESFILLENPAIVYDTGAYTNNKYADAQCLPKQIYIMKQSIEMFGIIKTEY
jgi:hypothetical protein